MERPPLNEIELSADREILETREKNADKVIDDFLLLNVEEKVLFLTDKNSQNTDRELIEIMKNRLTSKKIEFSELAADEKTSWREVLNAAKKCDLIWDSWAMEDTAKGTDFNRLTDFLEKHGKRMAWCPGVRAESLGPEGALSEDKEELMTRLEKMRNRLKDAVGLTITTSYGTDLKIPLKRDQRRWIKDAGIIKKGSWDNLPGGEIYTTPDEEKIEGVLVLPLLQDEVALDQGVDEFVRLTIKGGKIRRIDGGVSAEKLRKYLMDKSIDETNPESVLQCAEIAFGANSKARTAPSNPEGHWTEKTNPTTETEKRLGTMHIAFGDSTYGEEGAIGHTGSDVHLDFVIPRNGLTVKKFTNNRDFEKNKNGEKLIDQGGWNLI